MSLSSLSTMKVKVILGKDIRRWRYAGNSTLLALNEFAASSFNLSSFWLQYEDDEGDRLTLSSQNDFEDAFACALEEERKSLKIYVVEGTLHSSHGQQQEPKSKSIPSSAQQPSERKSNANNNCQQMLCFHSLFFWSVFCAHSQLQIIYKLQQSGSH